MNNWMYRVLELFEFNGTEGLWWRYGSTVHDHDPKSGLTFYARCNDTFFWGSADAEEITEEHMPILEQAHADLTATGEDNTWLPELYAARIRKERPQGAVYKGLPKSTWPLFDACGPLRKTGLGNPRKHPDE